jgi:hypothetical protein
MEQPHHNKKKKKKTVSFFFKKLSQENTLEIGRFILSINEKKEVYLVYFLGGVFNIFLFFIRM